MMNFALLRPMAASVLLCSLAACGGGGGGGSDAAVTDEVVIPVTVEPVTSETPETPATETPAATTTTQSLAQAQAAATALLDEFAPTNPPVFTALSVVPQSGSAHYAGYVFGDLSNDNGTVTDSVIGSLNIEVGFNAGGASFDGTASDFVNADDTLLAGQLDITNGSLDRDGNPANDATIGIGLAGTLTDEADNELVFGVQLEGDFLGTAYNAVGGDALGGVSVDGVDQNFDGGFIAER